MNASLILKLNKDRALKCGRYPLVFQIICKRKRRLIYTGYRIADSSFDVLKQCVISSMAQSFKRREVKVINAHLEVMRQQIRSLIDYLITSHESFTAENIALLYHRKQNFRNVFTFTESLIEELKAVDRYGSAKNYRYTLNALREFIQHEQLKFDDLDYHFLKEYELFLLKRHLSYNSVAFYLRNLRAIYNKAHYQGVLEVSAGGSPFGKVYTKSTRTPKRAIHKNVIRQIAELDLSRRVDLGYSRDLFMFSFYTRGMSFVDMVYLKEANIEQNTICYCRAKTKKMIRVSITEPLQYIIDKYRNPNGYVLPCLSVHNSPQQNYARYRATLAWHNRCLKEIAAKIGLDSTLTSYVARHSWATTAKEKGIPIAVISESLGHMTESITAVYLKSFEQRVLDEANRCVIEL